MNKTYNINLNGQAFCIDETAYLQLQNYIEALEKHYLSEEDGKEIMADIESRIAELFHEFLNQSHKEVISQTEIAQIIQIMGTLNDIIDEDTNGNTQYTTTVKRILYRDPEHATLGGVASGLATYIDIPRSVVRLLFILLTFAFGITILFYIILWIIIPKAVTPKQKMEMKGEKINVSNIEKNIRDTYNNVKKKSKLNKLLLQIEQTFATIFNLIGDIISRIGKVILFLLSIGGLIIGIFALSTIVWVIITTALDSPEHYLSFAKQITYPISIWIIYLLIFLLLGIPFGLLSYLSATHLCNWHKGRGPIFIYCTIIWGLTLFISLTILGFQLCRFSNHSYYENVIPVNHNDTIRMLNIKFNNFPSTQKHFSSIPYIGYLDNYLIIADSNSLSTKTKTYFTPNIRFKQAKNSILKIIIKQESRGLTKTEALNHATNIEYQYNLKNDTLHLNNYFNIQSPQWHFEEVNITIMLPEGYPVNLIDPPYQSISFHSLKNQQKFLSNKNKNQHYLMKEEKLIEI